MRSKVINIILKKRRNSLSQEEEMVFSKWYNEKMLQKIYLDYAKSKDPLDRQEINVKKAWEKVDKKNNCSKNSHKLELVGKRNIVHKRIERCTIKSQLKRESAILNHSLLA